MKQKVEERIIAPKEIIIGEANAKVKLVEYGDYESAESVKAHEVVLHLPSFSFNPYSSTFF